MKLGTLYIWWLNILETTSLSDSHFEQQHVQFVNFLHEKGKDYKKTKNIRMFDRFTNRTHWLLMHQYQERG